MTVDIIRGDARNIPLADATVDLIVTSPPYFALRSYTDDGGAHYDGQIGSEATPAEFLDALAECTREMIRVLKPSGSMFVNLGDKYAQDTERSRNGNGGALDGGIPLRDGPVYSGRRTNGVPRKSLIGIPWRYALRCIDDLGLILRAEIIWSKPNGLPESVTDRVRRSHEQWFHFTKMPRYFAAVDEIREEHSGPWKSPGSGMPGKAIGPADRNGHSQWERTREERDATVRHPLGKLPSSTWEIDEEDVTWIGGIGFCRRCKRLTGAGIGRLAEHLRDTASSGSTVEPNSPTWSVTGCTSDPSLTGCSSTTSAATGHASDPTTLNPSPSGPTSCAGTPSPQPTVARPSAATDTRSTLLTLIEHLTEAGCVGCVCAPATAAGTGGSGRRSDGSVWVVPTEPLVVPEHLGVDHFAAFPTEWPKRLIRGWCPAGVCTACGEGRRPVAALGDETSSNGRRLLGGDATSTYGTRPNERRIRTATGYAFPKRERTITGYACACPTPDAPTTPGVVLDPFGGTGTVALVAHALGRHGISVDLSADYCRLAEWRTTDRGQIARVLDVPKPPVQLAGQIDMFEEVATA